VLLGHKRRRRLGGGAILATLALALGPGAVAATASGPPIPGEAWSSTVSSGSARLSAEIDPNGLASAYHFEYIAEAAYEANGETFAGALKAPPAVDASISAGAPVSVTKQLFNLNPATTYRYRVLATNSASSPGYVIGSTHSFTTAGLGGGSLLPDGRGWEMVSPIEKNGGQIDPPGAIAAGGVLQAAAAGDSVTYGSQASFAGGQGAPPASQYLATRTAAGWSTQNITVPIFSGSYGIDDEGVPYQLFSGDLARGLLLNGDHCRGEGAGCAVANPPLAGTAAPAGYQDYYLRDDASGSFTALLEAADIAGLDLGPADFDLRFAGASPDLRHVVLSTCAALTPDATEVPLGEGCDPAKPNLYEWSDAGLALLNVLPTETQGTPGAALAAQSGAVSADGSHVYFTDQGNLYLREGAQTKQVDESVGGGGTFQAASADGEVAFFTKAQHLYRYEAAGAGTSTDITPSGGVAGVLGIAAAGDTAYYQDAAGLQRWHEGTTTQVAPGPEASQPSDYPPGAGTAQVSSDGSELLFVSKVSLSGYDNADLNTGSPDSEVYLYDSAGPGPSLTCLSCNPTNERPIGPSTIPGAIPNGTAPGSTDAYKPRDLSADGRRVFFDSADALTLTDTNADSSSGAGIPDVYEWEAQGEGSCAAAGGCVALISSGRSPGGASFIDASADGSDAFFLTDASLAPSDPGALDLYDARVGGGFAEAPAQIPCEGDACQELPPEPADPTLDTLLSGRGNPPVVYHDLNRHKSKKQHHKKRHKRHRSGRSGR